MRLMEIIVPRDQKHKMVIENASGRSSKMLESLEPPYH